MIKLQAFACQNKFTLSLLVCVFFFFWQVFGKYYIQCFCVSACCFIMNDSVLFLAMGQG